MTKPGSKAIMSDNVEHPKHYTSGTYECIDELRQLFGDEAVKAFCRCNVYKYHKRAALKNGQEDLMKADWYMGYLIKMSKEKPENFSVE